MTAAKAALLDLTAINEALTALSYCQTDTALPTDIAVMEISDLLLELRAQFTAKPWPELPHKSTDAEAFEAWHAARSAEQRADGRQ